MRLERVLHGGVVKTVRLKHDLPNYGVFDEKRVFAVGPAPGPIDFRGVRLGVPICEDIWTEDVCETLAETGADPLPYGLEANRKVLTELLEHARAQHILTGSLALEDVFVANTLRLHD